MENSGSVTASRRTAWPRRGLRAALFSFLIFSLLLAAAAAPALDVPPLRGYVNDYAGMISPAAKTRIETELRNFERSDSTQVFILTIPSLQGETLEDFSIKVAESWKAGQKGRDNGVIVLVAKAERKIRIEVGRGLEGRLTDLTAGQIVDLVIKPRFSRGDFDGGFIAAASAIIDAVRGEFKAQPRKPPPQKGGSFSPFFAFLIFGGIALFFLAGISRILGAVLGALGLPALIYFALFPLGLIPLIILALVGLAIGIFLPLLFSGWWGPGGGWWFFGGGGPWGGGGGGGDDGGGFGGGGGGDFGGGGASGDW